MEWVETRQTDVEKKNVLPGNIGILIHGKEPNVDAASWMHFTDDARDSLPRWLAMRARILQGL